MDVEVGWAEEMKMKQGRWREVEDGVVMETRSKRGVEWKNVKSLKNQIRAVVVSSQRHSCKAAVHHDFRVNKNCTVVYGLGGMDMTWILGWIDHRGGQVNPLGSSLHTKHHHPNHMRAALVPKRHLLYACRHLFSLPRPSAITTKAGIPQ
jgi:hypothetical protein